MVVNQTERVGMLVHSEYPDDVRVRREALALTESGHEVHVFCLRSAASYRRPRRPREECVDGVYVHRLPIEKKRGSKLRYVCEFLATGVFGMFRLAAMHLRAPFRVVHVHNMPDLLVFSGLLPKWLGASLILDVHDPMSELFGLNYGIAKNSFLYRLLEVQERISYRVADHLITVSDPMAENVAKKLAVVGTRIGVVQNLPDTSTFSVSTDAGRWPRHEAGLTILYSGTITEHYSLETAVQAIALASREIEHLRLLLVGSGNRVRRVLEIGAQLGVSDRIEYHQPVSHDELRRMMVVADIGISTHRASDFGDLYFSNKLLEYITQGLVVLTSRTKTVERYLPDDAVFYFPAGDAKACAAQIVHIRRNPELVRRRIANAIKKIDDLNWGREKERLLAEYDSIRRHVPKKRASTFGG